MMGSMEARLPLAILPMLLAGGCLGGADVEAGAGPESTDALDPELAHLRGLVVDEELRALNATVTLPQIQRTAQTDADGRFELVNLPPGSHELLVYAMGYDAIGRMVELGAGQTLELTLTLRALPVNGTIHETYSYVGIQPCQWYFEGTIAHCTFPYTAAHGGARRNGVNLSQYGAPPDLQDNRDRFNFSVRPDHSGVVSELFWKASSLGAVYQVLVIMCPWYDPVFDECVPPGSAPGTTGVRYESKVGTSPISITWRHPSPEHLLMAPYVWSRANVNGADDRPVGIAIDQKVEFYNTVFYGGAPPEGYSAGPADG